MGEVPGLGPGRSEIVRGAVPAGAINAVINGAIEPLLLAGSGPIPMSVDMIGSATHTVFGKAVPPAASLAMILTAIAHRTPKGPRRPFRPVGALPVVMHGLCAFGAVVTVAVAWQRVAGTIEPGEPGAVVLLAIVAGLVAGAVNDLTIEAARGTER